MLNPSVRYEKGVLPVIEVGEMRLFAAFFIEGTMFSQIGETVIRVLRITVFLKGKGLGTVISSNPVRIPDILSTFRSTIEVDF